MFHAANDTIGIEKVRRNETTIAKYILIRLQGMSTSILRKPTSMLHRRTRSNIIIYPSIKQYRNDQERKSILRLIAIVLYNISKSFLWERDQNIRSKEKKSLKI